MSFICKAVESPNNDNIWTAIFFIIRRFSLLRGMCKNGKASWYMGISSLLRVGGVHYRRFHCIIDLSANDFIIHGPMYICLSATCVCAGDCRELLCQLSVFGPGLLCVHLMCFVYFAPALQFQCFEKGFSGKSYISLFML